MNSPVDNRLPAYNKLPVFNVLTLGQRGVGKTVFLAGVYVQLNLINKNFRSKGSEIDCLNNQENLQGIVNYVFKSGEYPPPTLKITDFLFGVKRVNRWTKNMAPVCQLRFSDIPGETCHFEHPDFQQIILNSHCCCVFINGYQLATDSNYLATLDGIIQQVIAIASLSQQKHSVYPFALIFTQCDRLNSEPIGRLQIEKNLQPLIKALKDVNARYQRFYVRIPIIQENHSFKLETSTTEAPFLWLIDQLNLIYDSKSEQTLEKTITQNVASGFHLSRTVVLSVLGLLTVTGGLWLSYSWFFLPNQQFKSSDPLVRQYLETLEQDPEDFETLVKLADRYMALQQFDQASLAIEKIITIKPTDLNWQLNLAQLYQLTEQTQKAEAVYDRILSQDPVNFQALYNKALLRQEDKDYQAARIFFRKAEQAAPSEALKETIRQIVSSQE